MGKLFSFLSLLTTLCTTLGARPGFQLLMQAVLCSSRRA